MYLLPNHPCVEKCMQQLMYLRCMHCEENPHGAALGKDRLDDIVAAVVDVIGDVLAKIDLRQQSDAQTHRHPHTCAGADTRADEQTFSKQARQIGSQPQRATDLLLEKIFNTGRAQIPEVVMLRAHDAVSSAPLPTPA